MQFGLFCYFANQMQKLFAFTLMNPNFAFTLKNGLKNPPV